MKTVNNQVSLVPTQQNNHKGARHFTNMAITGLGVGATGFLTNVGLNYRDYNEPTNKLVKKIANKTYKIFEKLGEKLLSENTFLGSLLAKEFNFKNCPNGHTYPKAIKAGGAMCLVALPIALSFIVRGIYKAGKINGDN